MRLVANVIRISHAKFHCNRLTTAQDIQDYASLIFLGHSVQQSHRAAASKFLQNSRPFPPVNHSTEDSPTQGKDNVNRKT